MLKVGFALLFCRFVWAAQELSPITLTVGRSRSLDVPQVSRVAVANSKVLKVRALGNGKIWFSALRPGKTDIRIWKVDGEEISLPVKAVAGEVETDPEPVVKVALEFLELDGSLAQNVGVRWPEAIQFTSSGNWVSQTNGINLSVAFSSAQAWIQHLVSEGWGKVLAAPDLYVRLGEEAHFHSGGEIPVTNASEYLGGVRRNTQWKPYGITVKVRPQSLDYLNIQSDIQVEISEVSPTRSVEGVPGLTKRSLNTKMQSREGETVILSGLVRQADSEERSGLPLLSELPVIGSLLFGGRERRRRETEVFMGVTFSFTSRQKEKSAIQDFHQKFEEGPSR